MTKPRPSKTRVYATIALLALAGGLFLCIIFQAEFLWLGLHLEAASRLLYRPAFIVLAPLRGFAMLFAGPYKGHFPVAQTVLLSFLLPSLLYLMWRVAHRVLPRRHHDKAGPSGAPVINRRAFLAACGAAPIGGAGVYGVYLEPDRLRVARYEIAVAGLPPSLEGIRIAHVSDTHYGPFVTAKYLHDAMSRVNGLKPDLVVLTGDYVHKTPHAIHEGIGLLGDLRARLGVVAVLGNHEHWEGTEACRGRFREVGIPLLDNRHCFLSPKGIAADGSPEDSICLAGVDDLWEGRPSLEAAMRGVPPEMPRLVLSHNPDFAEHGNEGHRVDLMFSGHTHGGQVRLPILGAPGIPSRYGDKYIGGLCRGPWCPVLVSRGVGLAGLPIRLGVPPEIGLIRLQAANPRN